MKLLEVIRIPETSDATYETVIKFGEKLGKTCVTCKGEYNQRSIDKKFIKENYSKTLLDSL